MPVVGDPVVASFGLAVVAAPLLFAGVFEWSVVAIAGLAAFVTLVTAIAAPSSRPAPPFAWWLVAAVGWTAAQALPIPCSVVDSLFFASADVQRAAHAALGSESQLCTLSMDGGATLRETLEIATLAAVFVVACRLAQQGKAQTLRKLIAVSVTVTAAVTILHAVVGLDHAYGYYRPLYASSRLVGPLLNDNNLGGFLLLGLFPLVGIALDEKEPAQRYLWAAAALVVGATLLLTLSRSAVAAGAMGVALLSVLLLRRGRRSARRAVLFVGIGATLAVAWGLYLGAAAIVEQFRSQGFDKLELIRRAFALAIEQPLTGVGRGAFSVAFAQRHGKDLRFEYAENALAHWSAEWGLVFTLALVAALATSLWRSRRAKRSNASLGAIAALCAFALSNLLDFSVELVGVAFVATALLATVIAMPDTRLETQPERPRRGHFPLSPFQASAAVLVLVLLLTGWVVPSQAVEAQRQQLELALAESDRDAFGDTLEDAVLAHPAEPVFALLASTESVRHQDPQAGRWLNHAMRLAPEWPGPHLLAARWLSSLGRTQQAALELREAAQRDPRRAAPTFCDLMPSASDELLAAATPADQSGERFLVRVAECPNVHENLRRRLDELLLARDSNAAGPWIRASARVLDQGDTTQAVRLARSAQERAPTDARSHLALANALAAGGEVSEAIEVLRAGRPQLADPRSLLRKEAELWIDADAETESDNALAALRVFAAGNAQEIARVEAFRARLRLRHGNVAGAITAYEDAFRLDPRPEHLYQVGALAERLGDLRRATNTYQRLRNLSPGDARAERALRRIAARTDTVR